MLTSLYGRLRDRILDRWLGAVHAGLVVKGLYLQRAIDAWSQGTTAGRTILDAGCGPEAQLAVLLARRYPQHRFEACDLHLERPAILTRTNRLGLSNLALFQADLCRLEAPGRYDLVFCIDVLEHLPQLDAALDGLCGALRDQGTLLLHVPALESPQAGKAQGRAWSRYRPHREGDDHVVDGFREEDLRTRLQKRGLAVISARRTFGPATERVTHLYRTGEERGVKGIGLFLLPAVLGVTLLDWIREPRGGHGLWLVARKSRGGS